MVFISNYVFVGTCSNMIVTLYQSINQPTIVANLIALSLLKFYSWLAIYTFDLWLITSGWHLNGIYYMSLLILKPYKG